MLFNSIHFIFFFIIVTTLYFLIDHKYRWFLLLTSSCYFYMIFVPIYIVILGFTIVIDYFAGIYIEKTKGNKKRMFLILSLIANIGILAVFKYYNFINENITLLFSEFGINNPIPYLSILLPIGLSFHTFQAMSYTIEVYRGNQKAERNFGIYALYVMFYPQLVAGPIERPQNLLHQFYEKHYFEYNRIVEGLKLVLWGFFQKIVIADRLAIYVNSVFNNQAHHNGNTLALASIFFTIQVYCDFSGYSNIAIGVAKVMGFNLMTNFKRPLLAKSIDEFWKKWHISLSSWFRDYLYISLGGNRVSVPRWCFNLFFVFLISGLWHGAAWTYIGWGAITGFYLIFAIFTRKYRTKLKEVIGLNKFPLFERSMQTIITFLLICFSLIIFRSNSGSDALQIITKIFSFSGKIFYDDPALIAYSIFGILFLLAAEFKQEYFPGKYLFFNNKSWVIRNLTYSAIIILILIFGVFDGGEFVYFQF
ncbi:MAG: MBOAT family O-acyltransferase [bacterium]